MKNSAVKCRSQAYKINQYQKNKIKTAAYIDKITIIMYNRTAKNNRSFLCNIKSSKENKEMEENTNINTQPTQQPQPQQPYQQNQMPVAQLKTDRGLAKLILLSLITFGIYGLVVMHGMTEDVNTVCGRYDGKRSMNYLLMVLILTPITLGIYPMVWYHTISNRIGADGSNRHCTSQCRVRFAVSNCR